MATGIARDKGTPMLKKVLGPVVVLALTCVASVEAAPYEVGSTFQICGKINDCEFDSAENVGFLARSFNYTSMIGSTTVQSRMSGFAEGIAYYGFLGAIASGTFDDYRPDSYDLHDGGALIAVLANAMFKDSLTIRSDRPEPQTGILAVTFRTSGTMTGSGFLESDTSYTPMPGDPVGVGPFASLIVNDFAHWASLSSGVQYHTFELPFTFNVPLELKTNLWAGIAFFDSLGAVPDPYDLQGRADFVNTAVIEQLAVLDSSGQPMRGITIEAASGTTYPSAVPEPRMIGLIGILVVAGRHMALMRCSKNN